MAFLRSILVPSLLVAGISSLLALLLVAASRIFAVKQDKRLAEIRSCLPGNNCGGCGHPGCDAFASELFQGSSQAGACAGITDKDRKRLSELLDTECSTKKELKAFVRCKGGIDYAKKKYVYDGLTDCSAASLLMGGDKACSFGCIGLGSCIKKCNFDAITIENGVAVVNKERCIGCGACISSCPKRLIVLLPKESAFAVGCASKDSGAITKSICKNGCVGCTICQKSCSENAVSVQNRLAEIDPSLCKNCGLCAEKCPRSIISKLDDCKAQI